MRVIYRLIKWVVLLIFFISTFRVEFCLGNLSINSSLLNEIYRVIDQAENIVFYPRINPQVISKISNVSFSHFSPKINHWKKISRIWKNSSISSAGVVHVHNDIKIGDFLLLINLEFNKKSKYIKKYLSKLDFDSVFDRGQPPMVMTNSMNENWGYFSTRIINRTTSWLNMTNHLRLHNSNYDTLKYLLDSNKIVLITSNSHVDPMIGYHKKIICFPIGISNRKVMFSYLRKFKDVPINKTQLILINNSGWGPRKIINHMVAKKFNTSNTYIAGGRKKRDHFINQILSSKFVICPSGLGYDTYRLWETILLGSFPIVESNEGFDRTYSNLPVLVVKKFEDLSYDLLDKAYKCLSENAHKYKYVHLTSRYWNQLIANVIQTGSRKMLEENHPKRNKYCNFLD